MLPVYKSAVIPPDTATAAYCYLHDNVQWEPGVRSRHGFTRLAKRLDLDESDGVNDLVIALIKQALGALAQDMNMNMAIVSGVYLNYYADGQMYTPNHSHQDTLQLVISLGATRTLTISQRPYTMNHGDAVLFSNSVHGVPREPAVKDGRISIACFLNNGWTA